MTQSWDPPVYENEFTGQVARVVRRNPNDNKWYTVRSRNVGTGYYESVVSAQRALKQFKSGWRATDEYKVQYLYADSEGGMFWYDVS